MVGRDVVRLVVYWPSLVRSGRILMEGPFMRTSTRGIRWILIKWKFFAILHSQKTLHCHNWIQNRLKLSAVVMKLVRTMRNKMLYFAYCFAFSGRWYWAKSVLLLIFKLRFPHIKNRPELSCKLSVYNEFFYLRHVFVNCFDFTSKMTIFRQLTCCSWRHQEELASLTRIRLSTTIQPGTTQRFFFKWPVVRVLQPSQ